MLESAITVILRERWEAETEESLYSEPAPMQSVSPHAVSPYAVSPYAASQPPRSQPLYSQSAPMQPAPMQPVSPYAAENKEERIGKAF